VIRAAHVAVMVSLIARGEAAVAAQPDSGRVVVIVTTLDGTVRMPGVLVELRESSRTVVLASTTTDAKGMVVFPEVPTGRYIITATRAGFLVCNDLDVAARLVQTEPVAVGVVEPKEKIRDLIQWSISDEYFTLREHLGLIIGQG